MPEVGEVDHHGLRRVEAGACPIRLAAGDVDAVAECFCGVGEEAGLVAVAVGVGARVGLVVVAERDVNAQAVAGAGEAT